MGRDFHSTECVRLLGVLGLDKALTELIKVKASQVNGCSFCVQFQLNAEGAAVDLRRPDLDQFGQRFVEP